MVRRERNAGLAPFIRAGELTGAIDARPDQNRRTIR